MLTLTYAHTSFQMPRVMSMLLDAICLELERSPMSPHAHADQRTPSTWCKMRTSYTRPLSLAHKASVRTRNAPDAVYSAYPVDPHGAHGGMLAHNLHAQQDSAASLVATIRRRDGEGPWRRWRNRTADVSTHVTQHTLGSANPHRGHHRELG